MAVTTAAVGVLAELDGSGNPLVTFAADPSNLPVPARTTVATTAHDVGRSVVLLFEDGNLGRPIIVGMVREAATERDVPELRAKALEVEADGNRVTLSAQNEIVLRTGKATIVLTSAGKVLIRGVHIVTHSAGLNRIRGASVQIN